MHNQKKNRAISYIALCGLLLVCTNAPGQQEAVPATASAATEIVGIKVFNAPRFLKPPSAVYPASEEMQGNEGWVTLNFMIDPQGKPYEISVMSSTGIPAFEKTAIRAVEKATFQPATLGNTPVDSGFTMKMKFHMYTPATGANPSFVSAYRKLAKAVETGDRAQADEMLAALRVQNLYEDAYRNLGLYHYARKWGTEPQQLSALKAAIA